MMPSRRNFLSTLSKSIGSSSSLRWLSSPTSQPSSNGNDANSSNKEYFDVLIVGGGGVGCSLARLLNEQAPALKIGLMEARDAPPPPPPPSINSVEQNVTLEERVPHPRSYALSPNSLQILGKNVTSRLPLGYYDSMQVWQANSPASLTFTSRDLDADPSKAPYLGACAEDTPMVSALWNEIQDQTKCWTNTTLDSVSVGGSFELASVTTKKGETIEAGILVGADGGNSFIRKSMGVSRIGTEYEQSALTFTVELEGEMRKRAFQRFLGDGGPMALLPTWSPNHAVVVWSKSPETVQQWKNHSSDDELVEHLNSCLMQGPQRIPPLFENENEVSKSSVISNLLYGAERVVDTVHYGLAMASHHPSPKFITPPRIKSIVSTRLGFPLSCFQTRNYIKGRVALVGDAAHTVHPMAGQGLNLGLADVQDLANTIGKAHVAGMDVSTFLEEYGSNRQRNVTISLGGIHALQKMFGITDNIPFQHAKTFGMNMIQNFSPLRRQLAIAAAHGI